MIVVVTGVAGAGKTTVGRALARRLGWPFVDADDHHPPENVARMRRGRPLTDAEREPWLDALRVAADEAAGEAGNAVVTCSCLKERHRERLRIAGRDVRFVHLAIDGDIAARRLADRAGHFFGPELVASQIEDLEPAAGLEVDATRSPEAIVDTIVGSLALPPGDAPNGRSSPRPPP